MAVAILNTPEFRVSYPNVFKARKNELSGEDEYSVVALFPKDANLTALKNAAAQTLIDKFGTDQTKWPKGLRNPFRDQGEREKDGKLPEGLEAGAIFINLKAKQRPGVVDQNVNEIVEERDFYAGCYAIASVRPYYYDKKGNKGIAFGLNNIQKRRDGDPLGSRTRSEE